MKVSRTPSSTIKSSGGTSNNQFFVLVFGLLSLGLFLILTLPFFNSSGAIDSGLSQNNLPDCATAPASEIQLCREFDARWKAISSRLQADSTSWPRPVYMLGASHPQTNFIHFTGLKNAIDAFIDDNPAKANLLVPLARPVPIFPASKLLEGPAPGTIIRGAFGYEDWMDRTAAHLASQHVIVIKPYGPKRILHS